MSYCRFGERGSNVYIFSTGEELVCSSCSILEGQTFETDSRQVMLGHVGRHRSHGDEVPASVDERLNREIQEKGDRVDDRYQ